MPSNESGKRKRGDEVEGVEGTEDSNKEEATLGKTSRAAALSAYTGNGTDLASSLQTSSLDALRNSLSEIRSLTGLYSYNERPSPSDKRIQLAKDFCYAGGIGQADSSQENRGGVLNAWDIIDTQEQLIILPLPLFVLSNIIALLGAHQPTHDLVDDLIQKILPGARSLDETQTHSTAISVYWSRLQTYLSKASGKSDTSTKGKAPQTRGASEVVTLATLRLLLEMSTFAGGKHARVVFDNMNWTMKSLPRLLTMRRRANFQKKGSKIISKQKISVSLDRPDIRTLWILFLLSFLRSASGSAQPAPLQISALSLGREFLPAIFKGLANDPPQIVVHILMALHDGLLSEEAASKLPRSRVSGFFSEWTCKELVTLYHREDEMISVANTEEKHSVADVVHHFLLALCTHPGSGVCYVDQGWYGRKQLNEEGEENGEDVDQEGDTSQASGVYNKILLGLLKALSPTRSLKQAELTLRILAASQELIGPYLNATTGSLSSSSLEPRGMSIAWLSTATFMGRILGIPLPESNKWKPQPPSFDKCMESILPATLTKAIITRGILQKDKLTRHGALTLLSRMLTRLTNFVRLCMKKSNLYEENGKILSKEKTDRPTGIDEASILKGVYEESSLPGGPWMLRMSEVVNEVKLRCPDLATIFSSIEVGEAGLPSSKETEGGMEVDSTLAQTGDKQTSLSLLVTEAALRAAKLHASLFFETSIDLGKLLSSTSFHNAREDKKTDVGEDEFIKERFAVVCQLHAMHLLTIYSEGNSGVIDLFVKQSNKESSYFGQLLSLSISPTSDQVRETTRDLIEVSIVSTILFEHNAMEWNLWQYALDQSPEHLLHFVDECIQRCLKTPYRYIEAGRSHLSNIEDPLPASPIFFTMLEQYTIRLQSNLFGESPIKLAFPKFLTRLFPAMLTISPNAVSTNSLRDVVSDKVREALDKVQDTAEEEILADIDGIKWRISSILADSDSFDVDNPLAKEEVDKGSQLPLLLRTRTKKELDELDLDWEALFSFRVERNIILVFCKNALINQFAEVSMIQKILKEAQQSNQRQGKQDADFDLEDWSHILLSDERVLKVCREQTEILSMLLEIVSEGPLDSERPEHGECLKPLLQVAMDEYYRKSQDDQSKVTSKDRRGLVQLFRFLNSVDKKCILTNETDATLLLEVLADTEERQESHSNTLMTLLSNMEDYKDVEVTCRVLSLLYTALKNARWFRRSFSTNEDLQERFSKYILSYPDVGLLDDSLCNVLAEPTLFTLKLWKELADHARLEALVGKLPKSLACATEAMAIMKSKLEMGNPSSIPREAHEDLKSYKTLERDQRMIKACVLKVFDADQKIAIPLAQVCLDLCTSAVGLSLLELLASVVPKKPVDAFKPSAFLLVADALKGGEVQDIQRHLKLTQDLLDKALLWLVRRFAEDEEDSEETIRGVEAFIQLLSSLDVSDASGRILKAHLAEPVLSAAIANRMNSSLHVRLIRYLLKLTSLKPAVYERYLSDILQHKEEQTDFQRSKEIVKLVTEAIALDKSIFCKAELLIPLMSIYRGSLSKTDRRIMILLNTFEQVKKTSSLSLLQQSWLNKSISQPSNNDVDLDLLSRMDSNRLHETCLHFPRDRGYESYEWSGYQDDAERDVHILDSVYDPILVLSVVGALMARKDKSLSGLQWLELVRTNSLGVIVCCLSSRINSTRSAAFAILTKVYNSVEIAQFQEKDHLLLILDSIRNCYLLDDVIINSTTTIPIPLPLTTTLFTAHSLRSLGIPSLYLYPLISRFLLQRPTPDSTDVPLLYNFLYSSSAQSKTYKAERMFILRFLSTCIKYGGNVEWNIIKRRHVWDSICSLYAVRGAIDSNVKRAIEDIFIAAVSKKNLVFRIVTRHAFLNFGLQMLVVLDTQDVEREQMIRFWIHCLAEILEKIDLKQLEEVVGTSCYWPFANILAYGCVVNSSIMSRSDLSYLLDLTRIVNALSSSKHQGAKEVLAQGEGLLSFKYTNTMASTESQATLQRIQQEDPKVTEMIQKCKKNLDIVREYFSFTHIIDS